MKTGHKIITKVFFNRQQIIVSKKANFRIRSNVTCNPFPHFKSQNIHSRSGYAEKPGGKKRNHVKILTILFEKFTIC